MRLLRFVVLLEMFGSIAGAQQRAAESPRVESHSYVGFDRNDYPGDAALGVLRQHFSFVGYWLNNPPGEKSNSWVGKREVLVKHGFGFLVLVNGKEDAAILKLRKTTGRSAEAIGQQDAEIALRAAKSDHFPAGTILFLDQEEGGRLLPEQAEYLFGWI